ncbi:MAG: hypothetical protein GY936_03900 [Ignavibacteriae bacterium]|nr:hypothetical protein [Ignavibacteriota bacterium]
MKNKRYNHLIKEQRYQISVLLKAGHKVSFISEQLNIHHSTVYGNLIDLLQNKIFFHSQLDWDSTQHKQWISDLNVRE